MYVHTYFIVPSWSVMMIFQLFVLMHSLSTFCIWHRYNRYSNFEIKIDFWSHRYITKNFLFRSVSQIPSMLHNVIYNFKQYKRICPMHIKQDKFLFKPDKIFGMTVKKICRKRKMSTNFFDTDIYVLIV